ncbi:MAG TPA: response regulator [Agriterribacter sp.]|nr:response regulator [Agriterribacter sp.]
MDDNALTSVKDEKKESGNEQEKTAPLAMVVDNDPDTMLLIAVLLRSSGYRVMEASSGEKALALLQANHPAIIFMDVHMPVMDGYAATRRIRQMSGPCCAVPVIGLVAGTGSADHEKCLAAGMNDSISKPLRLEDILEKLGLPPAA